MTVDLEEARRTVNHARHAPGSPAGFYESFFLRANHPERPLAFWIRYTIFSPRRRPDAAQGELWAIWFDGETGRHTAVKREVPLAEARFARDRFEVAVAGARLGPGALAGEAASGGSSIAWDLRFDGRGPPLFLFPLTLYETRLPKAKSLVSVPDAIFEGSLTVGGRRIEIDGWPGTQNHNWGRKHTDHYAWGQVAGFDGHPDTVLEVASARIRLGPFWTPLMTPLVLRHRGEEFAIHAIRQTLRAKASFRCFDWTFRTADERIAIEGRIEAPREHFVGLAYRNPPGGTKHCLNTKIASCELVLSRGGERETLRSAHRAAFEILTDDPGHGVPISA